MKPRPSTPHVAVILCVAMVLVAAPRARAQDSSRQWNTQQMQTARYDVQPGGTLRVHVPDGNVVLETVDAHTVEIEIELAARDLEWAIEVYDSMDWNIDGTPERVTVRARNPRKERGWWRGHHGGYDITVRVRLPSQFDLDLDTGDGDIHVDRTRGRVRIETSDGDIAIADVEGPRIDIDTSDGDVEVDAARSPNMRIETSDGDIHVGRLDSADARLESSDGDIDVDGSSGALSASTSDGDIRVRLESLEEMALRSSDGDIHIEAPSDLKADIDLRGERLSLRNASLQLDGSLSETRARGALNGGGPRLSAVTEGRITLSSSTQRGSR